MQNKPLNLRQLRKELAYQRQFAGVPGVTYHRAYCQQVARLIRARLRGLERLHTIHNRRSF